LTGTITTQRGTTFDLDKPPYTASYLLTLC